MPSVLQLNAFIFMGGLTTPRANGNPMAFTEIKKSARETSITR